MDKNIKMISAKLALPYIKDNMIVGLGGGTTMGYVVNFLEKKLSFVTPIVLECIPSSRRYVEMEVQKLGGKAAPRTSYAKDGFTLSDHGNLLMDAEFDEVEDIPLLNKKLKDICGGVETSLFTDEVTKVLVASNEGYKVMKRC